MNIITEEHDFEYQSGCIFSQMEEDYRLDQACRIKSELPVQTFSEWLWENLDTLGKLFYERFDEWAGIEESTYQYNYEN